MAFLCALSALCWLPPVLANTYTISPPLSTFVGSSITQLAPGQRSLPTCANTGVTSSELQPTGTGSHYASQCVARAWEYQSALQLSLSGLTSTVHSRSVSWSYKDVWEVIINPSVPTYVGCDGATRVDANFQPPTRVTVTYFTTEIYETTILDTHLNSITSAPCSVGYRDCENLWATYMASSLAVLAGEPLIQPTCTPNDPSIKCPLCHEVCTIRAEGTARLLYWPITVIDEDYCGSKSMTLGPTVAGVPNTAVFETWTLTSPTVYISYDTLMAFAFGEGRDCTVGHSHLNTLVPVARENLRSFGVISTQTMSFNYADLPPNKLPLSAVRNQNCYTNGNCPRRSTAPIYDASQYIPYVAMPEAVTSIDPAWSDCVINLEEARLVFDSPVPLGRFAVNSTTVSFPYTTSSLSIQSTENTTSPTSTAYSLAPIPSNVSHSNASTRATSIRETSTLALGSLLSFASISSTLRPISSSDSPIATISGRPGEPSATTSLSMISSARTSSLMKTPTAAGTVRDTRPASEVATGITPLMSSGQISGNMSMTPFSLPSESTQIGSINPSVIIDSASTRRVGPGHTSQSTPAVEDSPSTPRASPLTVGSTRTFTVLPIPVTSVTGQTLPRSANTTPSTSAVTVSTLPGLTSTALVSLAATSTSTSPILVVQSLTLSAGGPAITLGTQVLTLQTNGIQVIEGFTAEIGSASSTIEIGQSVGSTVFAIGPDSITVFAVTSISAMISGVGALSQITTAIATGDLSSDVESFGPGAIVSGTTLAVGGMPVTLDNTTISLGPGGLVINGTTTIPISASSSRSIVTTAITSALTRTYAASSTVSDTTRATITSTTRSGSQRQVMAPSSETIYGIMILMIVFLSAF